MLNELLPQAENRVTLAEEKDVRGMPIAQFTHSRCENDRLNMEYSRGVIKTILEAAGAQDILTIQRYAHLIGGARMGTSPENSVLGPDHRVWGVENLFVADGSACPTQGSANPALTIMALSSRLAELLARQASDRPARPAARPARPSPPLHAALLKERTTRIRPTTKSGAHMSKGNHPEVVVVTGASGGVGRAIAHAFASRGAHVGLLARGTEGLEETEREVSSLGGEALAVPTDVADHEQVEAAAAAVEARFGEIDVWVNDAMSTVFARFVDTEPEEFRRATEVTYLGTVYGTMAALKRMRPRNRGKIVQVGSALAYRAIPLQAAYCGAKFGIRGFTDSIRTELLHEHSAVQITMVQLPGVNTTQFNWCRSKLPEHPKPVPPSTSPRYPRRPSTGPPTTAAVSSGSAIPRWRRSSAASSRRAFSSTVTSR